MCYCELLTESSHIFQANVSPSVVGTHQGLETTCADLLNTGNLIMSDSLVVPKLCCLLLQSVDVVMQFM